MTATPTAGPAPGLFPITRRKRRPSISYRNLPAPANAEGGQVGKDGEQPVTPPKPVITPRERMLRIHENERRKKQAASQLAAAQG